jgi:hypothetical protein
MKDFFMLRHWLPCCFTGVFFLSASEASAGDGIPKSFSAFEKSAVAGALVPGGLSDPLRAMWHAKAGQWEQAHEIAQEIKTPTGSWIHAFLHREEGDLANAGYWYRRAGMTMPKDFEIAEEWSFIARELWQREKGITPGEETLTSTSGLVATSEKPADAGEGAWDTLIRMNGKQVIRIENARPVSFSPAGDVLLLRDAAADDDCRHFLVKPAADAKIPPFGKRRSIGGRWVTGHQWSEDGQSITLVPDPKLGDEKPQTISIAEHLSL